MCFFVQATEESLHHLNTLLAHHTYEKVYFSGDSAQLTVETHMKMAIEKPTGMKASDILSIWHNDMWHNNPFTVPKGEHIIKMRWSIKVGGGKPLPVAYLREILNGDFYYTARQDPDKNVLHVTINHYPLSRFLMLEPFDMKAAGNTSGYVPGYVEYFQSVMPTNHEAVQQSYNQLVERCLTTPYDAAFQIPLTMHTVWITDPQNPKSPRDECFKMHRATMDVCTYGWNQIFWVHNKTDNPGLSVSPTNCPKTDQKIDVKELSELFNDPRLASLKPFYEYALWIKNYGRASDVARIAILYLMGGVYRDTDFQFLQDPKKLNQTCTFYAGFEDFCHSHLNNAMIASVPGHPILRQMIEVMGNPGPLPNEMQNPVHATLFKTGPFALTRAVFATDLENIGLLPHHVFYSPFVEKGCMPATQLGGHGSFKEWVNK